MLIGCHGYFTIIEVLLMMTEETDASRAILKPIPLLILTPDCFFFYDFPHNVSLNKEADESILLFFPNRIIKAAVLTQEVKYQ